ncbi:MAG: helix-turn-helix transcriptional regulator [Candidatus Pacebacteria bacterium]|nr:helix-turn-helix transcriptional regulator [Candidatus Paceibacterota bacterium]
MVTVLKVVRLTRQWNQAKAAELAGISPCWYSLIESGRLQPTEAVKERISKAFGRPAEELLEPIKIKALAQ